MRIRRLLEVGSAFVLSLSSLLVISMPMAHATPNNCLWNGSSTANFNTAANWSNCNSTVPQAGDNLVFDNTTIPTSGSSLVDNISGTTFGNITFQGSGSSFYTIAVSSGALTLSGNITDSTSVNSAGAEIDGDLTLTGSTPTVSVAQEIDLIGNHTLTTGANTVTFSGNGVFFNDYPIVGTGTLNFSMGSSSEFVQELSASPNYTGAINVTSGTLDLASTADPYPDMFSAASGITVSNGATLFFDDSFTTSGTITEPISAGGNGAAACTNVFNNGSVVDCGAIEAGLANGGNLTIASPVTLTANSQFNDNDTLTLTGPLSGNFTVQNAVGNLVVNSSNNTSGTANGTYGPGGVLATSGGSAASTKAPGTPDTGLAAITGNPAISLTVSAVAAGVILLTARRLKSARR